MSTTSSTTAWETVVALMAKIGVCASPSFSPDGTRIAFVSDLTGIPQVWTVATEGGWPQLVTALDDQVGAVRWSPDGTWLAFSLAPGGGMNGQIYIVRPDGSEMRRLTSGGKDNNWLGQWTSDARALTVSSNRRNADAMDSFLLDVTEGTWQHVATNPGIGSITDVDHQQRFALIDRMVNRGDNNLVLVDMNDSRETLLTPHEGPGTFENGRFAANSKTIYLISNAGRELGAFARIQLDTAMAPGPVELLAERSDAELQDFELTHDGRTVALLWNVAGRSNIALYDIASGTLADGPELPAEMVYGMTFSVDGTRLAFAATGSTAPMDIWVWELGTEHVSQVTHSQHAGVALHTLVRPELVRFAAHDDLELTGWLYRPRNATSAGPVVLSFHGGPEGQERPYFNSTYQALLAQGIAVLAPNVRGSSGFGKTFVNLDNGGLRYDAIRDIKACVDYVTVNGIANAGQIGIMGGSYGGYMTMAGLTDYPDLFAAGANLFGVVNFETFFRETEPWMAAISKIEYGDPDTEKDLLRDLSPIHKLDRVIAPTLVLHGANDTNVPVVEAEQVVTGLQERGIPVEYVLFPDEGHGFRKTPNRIRSTTSIVRWFVEHLKKL